MASEAIFFANLIASYLYLRMRAGGVWASRWHPAATELDMPWLAINTVILLSSSFPMHYAARSITQGNRRGLAIGLILTIILAETFLGIQAWEYTQRI